MYNFVRCAMAVACLLCSSGLYAQGSVNAYEFDGIDDYMDGNDLGLNSVYNNFTMEMWVNPNDTSPLPPESNCLTCVISNFNQKYAIGPEWGSPGFNNSSIAGSGIVVGTNGVAVVEHKDNYLAAPLVYRAPLQSGWNHIAVVYNALTPYLYLNGVLVATGLTSLQTNVFPSAYIGGFWYGNYSGLMDEVRIWDYSLSETEIRTNMTQKVSPIATGLMRYYDFDAFAWVNSEDLTGNRHATFINMNMPTQQVVSGAPIGDASTYLFPGSWASQQVSLSSSSKGLLKIDSVQGNPDGVFIYRVNSLPNSSTGLSGVGDNTVYFGTFVAGGTAPEYNITFDYNNYPSAFADEQNLELNKRIDNSVSFWAAASASVNSTANTLKLTSFSGRTELMLTNPLTPLPMVLNRFAGKSQENYITLSWSLTDPVELKSQELQKSIDGKTYSRVSGFENIEYVPGTYSFNSNDRTPVAGANYYRLKFVTQSGTVSYSDMVAVPWSSTKELLVGPLPAENAVLLSCGNAVQNLKCTWYDMSGRELLNFNYQNVMNASIPVPQGNSGHTLVLATNLDGQIKYRTVLVK